VHALKAIRNPLGSPDIVRGSLANAMIWPFGHPMAQTAKTPAGWLCTSIGTLDGQVQLRLGGAVRRKSIGDGRVHSPILTSSEGPIALYSGPANSAGGAAIGRSVNGVRPIKEGQTKMRSQVTNRQADHKAGDACNDDTENRRGAFPPGGTYTLDAFPGLGPADHHANRKPGTKAKKRFRYSEEIARVADVSNPPALPTDNPRSTSPSLESQKTSRHFAA